MAAFFFNSVRADLWTGKFVVGTDTFKAMLVTVAPSRSNAKRSDVTNEYSGTGYSAGGTAVSLSLSLSTNTESITVGAHSWTSATVTPMPVGEVIYKSRGGASSADELVAYVEFSGGAGVTAGTFAVPSTALTELNN